VAWSVDEEEGQRKVIVGGGVRKGERGPNIGGSDLEEGSEFKRCRSVLHLPGEKKRKEKHNGPTH